MVIAAQTMAELSVREHCALGFPTWAVVLPVLHLVPELPHYQLLPTETLVGPQSSCQRIPLDLQDWGVPQTENVVAALLRSQRHLRTSAHPAYQSEDQHLAWMLEQELRHLAISHLKPNPALGYHRPSVRIHFRVVVA